MLDFGELFQRKASIAVKKPEAERGWVVLLSAYTGFHCSVGWSRKSYVDQTSLELRSSTVLRVFLLRWEGIPGFGSPGTIHTARKEKGVPMRKPSNMGAQEPHSSQRRVSPAELRSL